MDTTDLKQLFINDAQRYKMIDHDKETELLVDYKVNGNVSARNKLVEANIGFIISQVTKYKVGSRVTQLDLINIASQGFMKAIEEFDLEKYAHQRLITYATSWVRASLTNYFRDNATTIRIPANKSLALNKAIRASKKHNVELNDEMYNLLNLTQSGASFSDPVNSHDESSSTLGDTMADETSNTDEQVARAQLRASIIKALDTLPTKQRDVISGVFGFDDESGEPKKLFEVGKSLGISCERTRQLRVKAIASLKENHPHLIEALGEFAD